MSKARRLTFTGRPASRHGKKKLSRWFLRFVDDAAGHRFGVGVLLIEFETTFLQWLMKNELVTQSTAVGPDRSAVLTGRSNAARQPADVITTDTDDLVTMAPPVSGHWVSGCSGLQWFSGLRTTSEPETGSWPQGRPMQEGREGSPIGFLLVPDDNPVEMLQEQQPVQGVDSRSPRS